MIGVADGPGEVQQLLVLLADGRRLVARELSEKARAELREPVAGRLRRPQSGVRPLVRWLHPVLPVDIEIQDGRVRRIALPVVQE
ncbi:hypothetical protein ACFC1T_17955 [Kitasatospora sp. NPDC056076]|uniref:hypothetical protein n=1 Tax=Kitasatospora sp. NPDC056076 TaxID=3345703 RepID=UPI0035D6F491